MKNKYDKPFKNADDYVSKQPPEYRETLEKLRSIVKESIPEAEEVISYQIICYKYIFMLVGIGTTKNHCSFYTMSPELVKEMKSELDDEKYSGATLHFPLNETLPVALIKKIIEARVKENKKRSELKNTQERR